MASFDAFLPRLLRFEGGFVNDPVDPGGATNKGITWATFCGNAQCLLGIEPTLDALRQLSDAQAAVLYKTLYWDKACGDQIELQALADIVVDFYVNAGIPATRLLQRVLNDLGGSPALALDGVIGPRSLQALQACDQTEVYRRYKSGRIAYYNNLVLARPPLQKFLRGWLNRTNAFPDL